MTTTTATKERPILFSGPMVRAILDGRKTQTRRAIKQQPQCFADEARCNDGVWYWWQGGQEMGILGTCPYGMPGENLWVRETWTPKDSSHGECVGYRADMMYRCGKAMPKDYERVVTRPWRPSIHMPRWASRITLEVTDVRVERVQSISAKDIIAEGAVDRPHDFAGLGKCPVSAFDGCVHLDLNSVWQSGWDSINKKRGFGWDVNPFCWVVTFKRTEAA